MTDFPAADYFNASGRTNGEAKPAQDQWLAATKQLPGASAEGSLTIASGVITPTVSVITIDTEGAAASDDLTNIATTNFPDGRFVFARAASAARVVTLKHNAGGAGQIALVGAADVALNATTKWLLLKRTGSNWEEVARFGFPATISAGGVTATELASNAVTTAKIADSNVTYAKVQNVSATARVLGRKTSGAGVIEELTLSEALDLIASTRGSILYRGASGWAVRTPGTSGQFLKTLGAGADPDWADAGGGPFTLLSSTAIGSSAVASVTITGLSLVTYPVIIIEFSGMEPTSDNAALYCQVGTSGGLHTSNNYHSYSNGWSSSGSANTSGAGTGQWRLTGAQVRSSTYGGVSGRLSLYGKIDSSMMPNVHWALSAWRQPDNVSTAWFGGGSMNNSGVDTASLDRIAFAYDTGNMKYGRISAYGLKYS